MEKNILKTIIRKYEDMNAEVAEEILSAKSSGACIEEMKPLYMKRQSFGISHELSIYRVFRLEFFLKDLENKTITFTQISSDALAKGENPLKDKEFDDKSTKYTLAFLNNYYGQYWTENPEETTAAWEDFGGSKGIRIKVNFGRFFNELVNIKDEYYMLHYSAVRVEYFERRELEEFFNNFSNDSLICDSLGHNTLFTLAALGNELSHEEEIRIIYNYRDGDSNLVDKNIHIHPKKNSDGEIMLCKHPFDWKGIVEEVVYGSQMCENEFLRLENSLYKAGISCPIICRSLDLI